MDEYVVCYNIVIRKGKTYDYGFTFSESNLY